MADAGGQRGEKWLNIAKAIAFELKPFSMPTRQDVVNAGKSVRTNVGQITAELKRVTPEAVRALKGVDPLRTLGLFAWLCGWTLFIWLEFGAVYFIVSAMAMIFVNLGEREDGEWSAYSVFNAGCKALLGTINAEQFEREIMRQNVAAPDRHEDDDDFVFVEPEPEPEQAGVRNAPVAAGEGQESEDDNEMDDESDGDAAADVGEGGVARGGGRKVSGKRARRGFEERRERQEERRLAQQALGPQGEWN